MEGDFERLLDGVASSSPTPGGGTVAAALGALGAALGEMVVLLTVGKERFSGVEAELKPVGERLFALRREFVRRMAEDAASYEAIVAARRMPKATDAERTAREQAMQDALEEAADVPLGTAARAVEALSLLHVAAAKGNPNAATDAGSGALACHAAALAALLNVRVNAAAIHDAAKRESLLERARSLELAAGSHLGATLLEVQRHLGT